MPHPPMAYRNEEWIPLDRMAISVDDLGFVLGATVTERLRTFRGRLFRLQDHWARLARSLDIVGGRSWVDLDQLAFAAERLVEYHRSGRIDVADWMLIVLLTPGVPGGRPTVCMTVEPLPFHQWVDLYADGQPIVTGSPRQVPSNCWPVELKCRSRMHYYLADQEARRKNRRARALVLDQDGFVAEATTANVLLVRNGQIASPLRSRILPGVSLGIVQEIAEDLGIPFVERNIDPSELAQADEMLLCSTSPCIVPVSDVDGCEVGRCPGPVFEQLIGAWSERVGVDIIGQATVERARRAAGGSRELRLR